jgi:hypothetical protein
LTAHDAEATLPQTGRRHGLTCSPPSPTAASCAVGEAIAYQGVTRYRGRPVDERHALEHAPTARLRMEFDMPQGVNLDAMIRREDLDVTEQSPIQVQLGPAIKLYELERHSTTFHILRKPDFQRETYNWSPEKIAEMVSSFVEGDLIPSIIVWRSPTSGKVFVIDGAHRLSALIAWINDDYGDETLSRALFGDLVNDPQQKKIAKKTRDLVLSKVGGSYERLKECKRRGDPTLRPTIGEG